MTESPVPPGPGVNCQQDGHLSRSRLNTRITDRHCSNWRTLSIFRTFMRRRYDMMGNLSTYSRTIRHFHKVAPVATAGLAKALVYMSISGAINVVVGSCVIRTVPYECFGRSAKRAGSGASSRESMMKRKPRWQGKFRPVRQATRPVHLNHP
jgi:hypothetical protein